MRNKNKLDKILIENKAQPVGWGYIDVIVKREYMENFLREILNEGFEIMNISFWEYCSTMEIKNTIGMGGPVSKFFDGWFSEIGRGYDVDIRNETIENKYKILMKMIKEFKCSNFDGDFSFENNETIMPSFDIDVPHEWHNDQD
ncbi:hypothetical protein FACS189485_21120 [Spirochaetia bacterium]|nr:hypothetical protein FACS189485_21120 [Spirochaetia bacterium]